VINLNSLLSIGLLGLAGLSSTVAGIVLASKSGRGYPQDPASVIHNYKSAWTGKIIFTIMFIGASMINTPVKIIFLRELLYVTSLLGPLYFPIQLILDATLYSILHSKEWCSHDRYIALNFMNIPFISILVASSVYVESMKLKRAYSRNNLRNAQGIVLGNIEMAVRKVSMITYPQTYMGAELKMVSEKWEVRKTPGNRPYIYSPINKSNPHICITGTSGVGKTTTAVYILAEAMRKGHRTIIIDPKGDISEIARARGWDKKNGKRTRIVRIIDVAREGVEPLEPLMDEDVTESVMDLINAMSIVEEVGANQKSLMLYMAEECERSFKKYYEKVSAYVDSIIKGDRGLKLGPHVRDAYMGIQSKLKILSTVFGKDNSFPLASLDPSRWSSEMAGIILDLSRIRDRYARAVTMELLLRKIEAFLRARGPLTHVKNSKSGEGFKHLMIMVDEVHEIARGEKWRHEMTGSILEDMAREARSYGAALILVTQRLSDIPDGIRSNIGLWLTLRTDSPHDMEVLFKVMPVGRISEIVTSMPDGYALIVEADPSRLERLRAVTSKPTATDEAYIVKLERKLLEYRDIVEEAIREKDTLTRELKEESTEPSRPIVLSQFPEPKQEDREDRLVERVINDALRNIQKDDLRKLLEKVPRLVVEKFIEDSRKMGWAKMAPIEKWSMPEEYVKYGLLEKRNIVLKATPVGRVLINSGKIVSAFEKGVESNE